MPKRRPLSRDVSAGAEIEPPQPQLALPTQTEQKAPDPQLDRIRDILFGTQMQTYEQQFASVRGELAEVRRELAALAAKLDEQAEADARSLESARRGLRVSLDHLRADLDEVSQRLDGGKVDKAALAELFVALGNRLKSEGGA